MEKQNLPPLRTSFAGLSLRNPIVIGSSGLTDTPTKIAALEKAGAAAVVLKSLFEEQILETAQALNATTDYPEAADYLNAYVSSHRIEHYLQLIREAKAICSIPVIASINCYRPESWVDFAGEMARAGADAIEINIMRINTSFTERSEAYEQLHIRILQQVKAAVSIPVIVKLGKQFSSIVGIADQLYANGAAGVVLFNRYYQPDIDIERMEFTGGPVFSAPSDFGDTLRWLGIVSGQLPRLPLAASTGIHEPAAVVKAILAGAAAVEICSAVYQSGNSLVSRMLRTLESWMETQGFDSIDDFRGRLNYRNTGDQSVYERVQFMKYFSSREG